MKQILASLALLLALAFTAQAAVYRAGFRQGRFWLNYSKTVPSFDQDAYAATSWDWTLSAMMCNVTGNAGASGVNPVSGNTWDWQNYYGYVYDGEMWMEAGTTYTFGGNFDDGSAILVDGAVAWAQGEPGGTGSGYNNWVAPRTYTPDATGWHALKLLVWDWEGGKNITSGALSATMWNTNGTTTAAPTSDWSKFADDGSGTLFRAKLSDGYLRIVTASATAGGYAVTVENLAPQAVEMKLFAGATDLGETDTGWTSESQSVSFAAGETKDIEFAWTAGGTPVYRIYLSGEDTSLLTAKGFWEWSEARTFRFVPSVSAAFSATTATSATVSVTCGYAESMEGSSPDIAVTAYYGPVSGGHDPSAWANSTNYPAMQPGNFTDTFTCAAGESCNVVFAASINGGEPVWSDILTFGASLVSIAAPERVLECETEAQSITLARGAADGWQAITVNLAYTGDTADFSTLPSTVEFGVGETEKSVSFSMVDNAASDGNRTLVVAIAAGSNYVAGAAASASILVVDDETAAQVCEWTGGGNGTDWSDPNNWSTHAVPTKIDTALFGENVTANLTVTMTSDATARLVRFESAAEVKLGAAATPAFDAMDMAVAEGAGIVRIASNLAFDKEATFSVATNATLALAYVGGTADLVKEGPGRIVLSGNNNSSGRTAGATIVKAGRLEFASTGKLLGRQLVVGGFGEPAVAYATYVSQWNWNPMSGDYVGVFEVGDKGVLDLSANQNSVQLQSMSRFSVFKGGTLKLGKTRVLTTGADAVHFFLEGAVESSPNGELNMASSGRLVIPDTRDNALVFDGSIRCKGDYYSGGAYEGGTAWGSRYPRFFVADIPGVPVDFVLNGHVYGQGEGDGFDKRDPGVMRMTSSNGYGGKSASEGMTRVHGGTLLLDNVEGSATGKSRVEVAKNSTLGGTGFLCGLENSPNAVLSVVGAEGAPATVAPGTIDDATGDHVYGTLTVGSAVHSTTATFGNYGRLAVRVGATQAADALIVHGSVDISATGTELVVSADPKASGGTYTILEADAISGTFANVVAPGRGWKIVYETKEVDGEPIVTRIDLIVPEMGTVLIVR